MANNNFFDKQSRKVDKLKKVAENETAQRYTKTINKGISTGKAETKASRVVVSEEVKSGKNTSRVIDLKEYFRKSPKAKQTSTGGWSLVVPIRRYANRKLKDQARGMSSKLYKEMNRSQNNTTVSSDYLYANRTNTSSIPGLDYTPKSNNITKKTNPRGRGSVYISFRTVSNKSAPNSWILNKDKAEGTNLTAEVERIIREVGNSQK